MINAEDISRILRVQAWNRAKGELTSMLTTYYGEANGGINQYEEISALIEEFIDSVENNGLHE